MVNNIIKLLYENYNYFMMRGNSQIQITLPLLLLLPVYKLFGVYNAVGIGIFLYGGSKQFQYCFTEGEIFLFISVSSHITLGVGKYLAVIRT